MAIDHISTGDTGSISKINAAIDRVNAFEDGKIDNAIGSGRVLGRSSPDVGPVGSLVVTGGLEAASGDLRIANEGVTAAKLGPGSVLNNKMVDVPTNTFKGRVAAGAGSPTDLTVSQMKTALGIATLETGLSDEVTARSDADAAETDARIAAVNAEASTRASADTAESQARAIAVAGLQGQINLRATKVELAEEITARQSALTAEADARIAADAERPTYGRVSGATRPGEAISYFTDEVDGDPAVLAPLPGAAAVASAYGNVVKIAGAGIVAPVAAWRIEPGHLYRVRFVVRRAVDTEDPANDAVRLGVRWLKSDKTGAATTELANLLDITVADGRVEYVFTLATVGADDVDAAPPADGVYFRPFIRTFGGGETHVEVIQVVDATDAVVWSPDVELLMREIAALTAQVQSLTDRVTTLES
ncbi:MAG: hypothetical protein ACT6U0_28560 [Shinella sp.]|uniref:hypothetical protein n=1 Tax=Shinella sp. TaxID=1870904 RepID=UPI0040369D0D